MVGDGIDRISRWIGWGVDFEPGGVVLVHSRWSIDHGYLGRRQPPCPEWLWTMVYRPWTPLIKIQIKLIFQINQRRVFGGHVLEFFRSGVRAFYHGFFIHSNAYFNIVIF
jgi:hypothetical protein